jgi:hypothetical protein
MEGKHFFHMAAARRRQLVPSTRENMARCVFETRCDESCIPTIVDPNDATDGSQEHAGVAVYREIVFETSTYRCHPEAECV